MKISINQFKQLIVLIALVVFYAQPAQAQLLEKLKERAKEKGLETREVSLDTTDNAKNRTATFEQEELQINSAKDFFTTDVIMKMYHETNEVIQTQFFDADVFAMRIEQSGNPKPLYQDGEGMMYAYNDSEGHYEKASILPSSSMGFMMAGMIPQAYNLPQQPYLEAYSALQELDISISYLVLEIVFIYKPHHFENNVDYTPKKVSCNGSENCIKYIYSDPEYAGSYILFDEQGKLSEFYINSTNTSMGQKAGSGKFVFTYQDCSVKLPDAVEQSMIPGPFGKMLNLERGLEPWKYNKNDKQKNKN